MSPLRILNFATFLQYQRFVMPISFLFYLYNGLNFSDFIFFQSIFNITCLIAKIPMGYLGDLFSKKFILIVSYFLFMLRVVLWIFFRGFWIILAGEILYGLFKALYRGNVDSYIYEYLEKNQKEKNMVSKYGKLSFFTSVGSALSCIAGVILYKFLGFKAILSIELLMQIFAVILLFFIPNIKTSERFEKPKKEHFNDIKNSIKLIITNSKVNYYVYYSAFLTGITGILVWNFQPLLKISSAPVIIFGVVSFINQILRGIGGLCAKKFLNFISQNNLLKMEYLSVILSFLLILACYKIKLYIPILLCIVLICFAIMFFVIFNVLTVSKIHDNTDDCNRAVTSSTNTFFGDFASFFLLLVFKYLYDNFGIQNSLLIFLVLFTIILFPIKEMKKDNDIKKY